MDGWLEWRRLLTAGRRGQGREGRRRKDVVVAFHIFLPHSLHYTLSISHCSLISISHLNQVFSLPSMVIKSPWQPWDTEQQEPTVGCLSFCSLSPSVCLSLQFQCGLALFLTFCSLPKHRQDNFTLFLHTSLPMWSWISIPLSPTLLSSLCVTLFVPLSVKKTILQGWWKVGSPTSHVESLDNKHVKLLRICQSHMMIRVSSLSIGTELSFVMQDILPYYLFTSYIKPSSDKGFSL